MPFENPEAEWEALLTGHHPGMLQLRRHFRSLPSSPRCKMCYAPFKGAGGIVLRPWFGPWERNAQLCKSCMKGLAKFGVSGAEVEISMLFADIRGSTGLAERMRPVEFTSVLSAFYRIAAGTITDRDGVVDKFVGDEAIGLFIPGFTGPDHAAKAIAAGRSMLEAVARPDASPMGAIPVGAGIHTGVAYVGTLGSSEAISDFTALGDPVNTTARLASLAAAGELLISDDAAKAGGLDRSSITPTSVGVRGRKAPLDVFSVRVAAPGPRVDAAAS